jgi:hypothetical protein
MKLLDQLTALTASSAALAWVLSDITECISAAKRKSLQRSQFALTKKYPSDVAARVRTAVARLEQARKAGSVSVIQYKTGRAAILRAAEKFEIHPQYLAKAFEEAAQAAYFNAMRV